MNKLLLTTFSLTLLITSCIQGPAKKDNNIIAVEQDATTYVKPKYKADIRRELEGYFTHTKSKDTEQVMPKYLGSSENGIYCYFFTKGDKALSLKLHIQYPDYYEADLYELDVDGETIAYEANVDVSSQAAMSVAGGAILQWYDKRINLSDEEFFRKTENASDATLRFKVKESNKLVATIKLSRNEFQSLLRTIDYYKSLNGAKIAKKGMVNIRG